MTPGKFTKNLKKFFDCSDGAYSVVTDRESRVDSQITVTSFEAAIMEMQFPEIETGSVSQVENAGRDPQKKFRLYPTGREIALNMVRPKGDKNELRLYLRTDEFRPAPHLIWFVFSRDRETWIGALSESEFSAIKDGNSIIGTKPVLIDADDQIFQDAVYYDSDEEAYEALVKKIRRDPAIAKMALSDSGHRCEVTPELPTFVSRATGKPYLEVHHFVPMGLQSQFELKLDTAENLAVLHPLTHRSLHHGVIDDIAPHISAMAAKRAAFLENLNLSEQDLMEFYS